MKKVKLIIALVATLGLISSSTVYADGFAAGEGLYLGAFAGAGSGIVQPKVTTQGGTIDSGGAYATSGGTFEAAEGGLGMLGFEGGGWIGYGYKMGGLYAGLEGEVAGGDVEFKLTSSQAVVMSGCESCGAAAEVTFTEVSAKKEWTGGLFGRLGYYLNEDTLLAVRGGALVSKFEVTTTGSTNYSEEFYGGGPAFGVSLESTLKDIDPNLSMRVGMVYTDYMTAPVSGIGSLTSSVQNDISGYDAEITGAALSARVGITYSFLDVNSLF